MVDVFIKQTQRLLITLVVCLLPTCLGSSCPTACQCLQADTTNVHVTCANQSLLSVPDDLPNGITSLDLHSNSIQSLTPTVFQNVLELLYLDLGFNQLSVVNQSSFENLWKLEHLDLQHNSIISIQPRAFSSVPRLEDLNLSNNKLQSLDSVMFFGLSDLRVLDLHGNRISNISLSAFLHISSVERLDLSFNGIEELPNFVFNGLNSLQILQLQGNQLRDFPSVQYSFQAQLISLDISDNFLDDLENMQVSQFKQLNIGWNNITSTSPQMFANATKLTSLWLDGNPVSVLNHQLFGEENNLRVLSLANMPKLHYMTPNIFTGLDNLTVLNMSYNYLLSFIDKDLFVPLQAVEVLDLQSSNISVLHNVTFRANRNLKELFLGENKFQCNCGIQWLVELVYRNDSVIQDGGHIRCFMPNSQSEILIKNLPSDDLHCAEVLIVNYTKNAMYRIGSTAVLTCHAISEPAPEVTWITPRKRMFTYHNFHKYAIQNNLAMSDVSVHSLHHADHSWHDSNSYYSESELREDRIMVLEDGSLYIDYVMRTDAGPYTCIASNPQNTTQVVIDFKLDYRVLTEIKIMSYIVGFVCAGSFFLLNLIYSLTLAAVRRCVSQRRRERIRQVIESLDHYKTTQIARIKENYNTQVGRIRDQYHYQLGRLREHNAHKVQRMGRIKEGCSNKMERIRENYNTQLAKLKEYSSSQLVQIRERYNNQILKMKDYGSLQFERIHEKYKLQQQHVIKLLEVMNLDNCRTVFESECVRTESMILESGIFTEDVPISPLDSASISDSEYMTATSSESSVYASQENIQNRVAEYESESKDDENECENETEDEDKDEGNEETGEENADTIHPYVTQASRSLSLQVRNLADDTTTPLVPPKHSYMAPDGNSSASTNTNLRHFQSKQRHTNKHSNISKTDSKLHQHVHSSCHPRHHKPEDFKDTRPYASDKQTDALFIDMPDTDTLRSADIRESVV